MSPSTIRRRYLPCVLALAVLVTACSAPTGGGGSTGRGPAADQPRATKTLSIAIVGNVNGMSAAGDPTTAGGWQTINELHTQGLVTSEENSRKPIGRLAERVPTFEDGSIELLPSGQMRITYPLRRGVTWHDGSPFTSADMTFTFQMASDPAIPSVNRDAYRQMDTVEAPDDFTLVITYKGPFYLGATLGPRIFWPMPRHLLQEPLRSYEASKNAEELLNLPYWTTEYVNTGPFRVAVFEPGAGITFHAYDGYFLGRPRIDVIRLQTFSDQNALLASLLAGATDIVVDSAIGNADIGFQLKDRWDAANQGSVYIVRGTTWFLTPQWRPSVQTEAANLDVRVRAALYRALDREALADGLLASHRELAAWSILPEDSNYGVTRDAFRGFGFDANRARAELADAGWVAGTGGALRNAADGREFRTVLTTVPGRDKEIAAFASYWRQVGLVVEEVTLSVAATRDGQTRATYPGWESTAQGGGDAIFAKLEGPAASAENRWAGNRGGYDEPRGNALVNAYRQSIRPADQSAAVKAISDYAVSELPLLILYFTPRFLGVRKGVNAFGDVAGGSEASVPYGTYTRNAHLWDLEGS